MDYEAPAETNHEYANVVRWSVKFVCRCGQESWIDSKGRYVRQTCRSCGTVWEISPSICDSTPYTTEKGTDHD